MKKEKIIVIDDIGQMYDPTNIDQIQKEYICDIKLVFSGNNIVAKDKKEYIRKVKDDFKDQFNIELDDKEIINIEIN